MDDGDRLKRAFDVALSAAALAATAPVLGAAALAVRLTSPGPALHRGLRAGLDGQPFHILKLRTMVVNPEADTRAFTAHGDSRITPVGAFLRLTKLDELPQFWNVLRGDMSIVGPRPEALDVVDRCYTAEQRRVLSVRPGITCYVQVRHFPTFDRQPPPGVDPETFYRTVILPERLVEDLEYVDRRSPWVDLGLVLQTAVVIPGKSLALLLRDPPPEVRRAARSILGFWRGTRASS